jgi:hypothetical protein
MPVRILWIENENIKWLLLEVEGSNGDEDVWVVTRPVVT